VAHVGQVRSGQVRIHDSADWQCLPVPAETATVTAAQPDLTLTLNDSEVRTDGRYYADCRVLAEAAEAT
jgi:hypothetical protein